MLSLTRAASNNSRVVYLVVFLIFTLGYAAYQQIPKSEDPQFILPISLVEVIVPGMEADDIEALIVDPIEEEFDLLEDVESIEAHIKNGAVSFEVRFLYGTSPDASFDEVVRAVSRTRSRLPERANLLFFKASPTTVNVFQIALTSADAGYVELERQAVRLKKRLGALADVNKAEIWALPEQVVRIDLNPQLLSQHKLTIDTVKQHIAANAQRTNAGFIDTQQRRYTIGLSGAFDNLEQIRQLPVPTTDGPLPLSQFANVYYASHQPDYKAYRTGTPAVFITLQQRPGANIFHLKQQVDQTLSRFSPQLPKNITLDIVFDQSKDVESRISGFMDNLWLGLGLILVALLLFIGFKEAVLVALTIPLSVSVALLLLNAMGFAFQQMSIAGLIIALGLLVDNGLVVVESVSHRLKTQPDSSLKQAVLGAVGEVAWPITSGTLTTLFAFLPLLSLQSNTGDFMRALPISVSLVLLSSLIFAIVVIPALMVHWRVRGGRQWSLQTVLFKVASRAYRPCLSGVLRWPLLSVFVGLLIAAGLASFFPKVGVSLFPKAEKNIIVMNIETPPSSSLSHTRTIAFDLSSKVQQHPNVDDVVTNIGASNPRIYYNHLARRGETGFAQLMIHLDSYDADMVPRIIGQWRQEFANDPRARISLYEFQQGPVTDRPITFRLVGDDLDKLKVYGQKLAVFLRDLEGTNDVRFRSAIQAPKIQVDIDPQKAFKAGLSMADAEDQLKDLLDGTTVGQFNDPFGETFRILVSSGDRSIEQLLNQTYVQNQQGTAIPLSSIASVSYEAKPAEFFHYQTMRMVKVSADYLPGYNVQSLTQQTIDYLETLPWDQGVEYVLGGEEKSRQQSFGGLTQIMVIALGAIFTILVIQFRSLLQPLIIFSIMPIAITGSILGLYLTGNSFSLMGFIGLISLLGIVVNDSIIMVDSFNRNRKGTMSRREAMLDAAAQRFTPIIFTSLTTILGLLPLTLMGGALWEPMGWVIITGLGFSTLTCLFFVPAVSLLLTRRTR